MTRFVPRSKTIQLALVLTVLTPLPLLAQSPAPAPDAAKPSIASIVVLPAPTAAAPAAPPVSTPSTTAAQIAATQQTRAALPTASATPPQQPAAKAEQTQAPTEPVKVKIATRRRHGSRSGPSFAVTGSTVRAQIAQIMRRPEVQSLLAQYGGD